VTCQFSSYLAATLLVEIGNVFLHQRRLYLMAFRTKETTFYHVNTTLLLVAMILVRHTTHWYLLLRVWTEYRLFGNLAYWLTAFSGMLVMNTINVQLTWQLWNADWRGMLFGK
jgi:hypothetical protein